MLAKDLRQFLELSWLNLRPVPETCQLCVSSVTIFVRMLWNVMATAVSSALRSADLINVFRSRHCVLVWVDEGFVSLHFWTQRTDLSDSNFCPAYGLFCGFRSQPGFSSSVQAA